MPLALKHTGFLGETPSPSEKSARAYENGIDVTGQRDPSYVFGAGDMVSDVRDLTTFVESIHKGTALDAPSLAKLQEYLPVSGTWSIIGYGFGFAREEIPDASGAAIHLEGHGGAWDGLSQMHWVQEWNAFLVLLANERFHLEAGGTELLTQAMNRLIVALDRKWIR